jgi:3-hydroxymyristoyl/3-hydroxydecanoyl-(acyl carrier protein) dehydratase
MQKACAVDVDMFCKNVAKGEARVIACLRNHKDDKRMTAPCQKELHDDLVVTGTHENLDYALRAACNADKAKFCGDVIPGGGKTRACMRLHVKELSDDCRKAEFNRLVIESSDISLSTSLAASCAADKVKFCSTVKPGEGRTHKCIRDNYEKLSPECKQAEFEHLKVSSSDIRLKPAMQKACAVDVDLWCKNVPKGEARVIACLRNHKDDAAMTATCKAELFADLKVTLTHENLDYALRAACNADKAKFCGDVIPGGGKTRACMRLHVKELSDDCRKAEFKRLVIESSDMRLSTSLAASCAADKVKFCSTVKPGEGRTHKCIRDNYEKLSPECKQAEFEHLKVSSSDIRLKPTMQKACAQEVDKFCKNVPKGDGNVIACLRENVEKKMGMSQACKDEVGAQVVLQSNHVELNVHLSHACAKDTAKFCNGEGTGTAMHVCLRKHYMKLSVDCKRAEFIEIIDEGKDYRIANILSRHCKDDHFKFCKDVKAGNGRVHSCMHDHLHDLTQDCRLASFDDLMIRSLDIRLKPSLLAACQEDIGQFCSKTNYGNARVLRCLQDKMGNQLSGGCETQLAKDLNIASSDIRLRSRMQATCAQDVKVLCVGKSSGEQQECLVSQHTKIKATACAREVRRAIKLASLDIRADPNTDRLCKNDKIKYCSNPAGVGSVKGHTCLRINLDKLTKQCKEAVLTRMKVESYSVDFKQNIASACVVEMGMMCPGVVKGEERMLKCLQDQMYSPRMGEECRKEIEADFKATMG